jgi:predicted lipid-binding transport protein (Tim44 family)
MTFSTRSTFMRALIVAVAALFLAAGHADARAGRGGGFGSRGSRTFQAPPPTTTAPRPAAPIDRSVTQPGPAVNQGLQRPLPQTARPGFFSNRGGFLGGLVGAGLIGMLLGYGLFGGLGGLGSILGLLLQVLLVVFLVRLAFRFFQRRSQPAYAGAGAGPGTGAPLRREAGTAGLGGLSGAAAPRGARVKDEVGIQQGDLDQFERTLVAVQTAYGAEDEAGLRGLTTPEMASYFAEELRGNASRGVRNHLGDVRLLQGDLAESWREGGADYATVAMRFSLKDWTTDRATGQVVEGDPDRPAEATEVWTFTRPRGGRWVLSAIQQA